MSVERPTTQSISVPITVQVTMHREDAPVPVPPVVVRDRLGFAEGPVVTSSGDLIVVSVDQGFMCRVGADGSETVVHVGGGPNGATEDGDGTIYIANNGSGITPADSSGARAGRVEAVTPAGDVRRYDVGMTSPNDLCFGPDGLLYVTDPTRPVGSRDSRIWRLDPATGVCEQLATLDWYANGIGFAEADGWLYVADTDGARIVRMRLGASLGPPEVVVTLEHGRPDGFAFDVDGHIVVGAVMLDDDRVGEIQTWSLDGDLAHIEPIPRGRLCTNVFLTPDGRLMATVGDTGELLIYAEWPARGLPLHPFR